MVYGVQFVSSGQFDLLDEREKQDVKQLWVGKLTEQRNSLGQLLVDTPEQQVRQAKL